MVGGKLGFKKKHKMESVNANEYKSILPLGGGSTTNVNDEGVELRVGRGGRGCRIGQTWRRRESGRRCRSC